MVCSAHASCMGLPNIKSLHHVARLGADLKVTCKACHHVAVFAIGPMIAFFINKGGNYAWELVAGRFRCDRCGSKRVRCGIAPPVERIALPKPEPTWREVKEHIRRTRG